MNIYIKLNEIILSKYIFIYFYLGGLTFIFYLEVNFDVKESH